MTEATPALVVSDLEVVYQRGGQPAAQEVAFTLEPSRALLVTGDHGSGKTSVLRALLGLVVANGEISVFGSPPASTAVTRRIGYGPQGRTFLEGHTAREVLDVIVALRTGRTSPVAADGALERAGLPPARRHVRTLDVEEVRRVSLACAIAADPDLLVLDDPWEFPETMAEVDRARSRGAALVVATDDPGGFAATLDQTLTLVDGRPT